ncbi:Alpha/beta hydrolase fold-1 [Powellomyces hirtus]|nr:Alpha/beta hydrolase fold-1 [Powellomyces hirtus]
MSYTPKHPLSIVFVHGAWQGPDCFDAVRQHLSSLNITTHAVCNRSSSHCPSLLGDLHSDSHNLHTTLHDLRAQDVVVVGHSYGGMVITAGAATAPNVKHLVYLTAFVPLEGQSLMACSAQIQRENQPQVVDIHRDEGYVSLKPETVRQVFYHDLPEETYSRVLPTLKNQSLASFAQVPTAFAYKTIPATYIVATEDPSLVPELQRWMIEQAGIQNVVEIPTGHSPYLSQPKVVADTLAKLLDTVQ